MKKSTRKIFSVILLFCILFCSCSPQRRLEKIITNNPNLLETKKILYKDTILLAPKQIINTQFCLPNDGDTITCESDVGIAIIYKKDNYYFLDVKTKESVIYNTREINIPILKTQSALKISPWISIPVTAFILFCILFVIKFINPKNTKK